MVWKEEGRGALQGSGGPALPSLYCGSRGPPSAQDWEGGGEGSWIRGSSLPASLSSPFWPGLSLPPLSVSTTWLLFRPPPLVLDPHSSLLLASFYLLTGPQRDLSTLGLDAASPLLTHLAWLPSAPAQSPSPSAWPFTVARQLQPWALTPGTCSVTAVHTSATHCWCPSLGQPAASGVPRITHNRIHTGRHH